MRRVTQRSPSGGPAASDDTSRGVALALLLWIVAAPFAFWVLIEMAFGGATAVVDDAPVPLGIASLGFAGGALVLRGALRR
jgi:hypothetical protein